jgi:hypothetical protein
MTKKKRKTKVDPATDLLLLFLFLFVGALVAFAELFAEFFDSAHRVNELLLARVKRMGCAGNVDVYDRVFVAVFPLNRFFRRFHRRTRQNSEVSGLVLENNGLVFGVNVVSHFDRSRLASKKFGELPQKSSFTAK